MTTIDDKFAKIVSQRPDFDKWLSLYDTTGHRTYQLMVEIELKEIRKHYGPEAYRHFEHIYNAVREVNDSGV